MKSNKYKPLLLNDLIGLFIQQKYNCDENKHFCINYFIDKEFVNDLDINYFNEIFEEVHLTKQEDGSFSLELFNLKKSVLEQFEFCYQNNLLDTAYTHIIHFEKILFKKIMLSYLPRKKCLPLKAVK